MHDGQCCQRWLISRQVAYFEKFWRAKKVAYKPPKCGLFSTLQVAYFQPWISHQIVGNCGLNVAYFYNLRQFSEIFLPAAAILGILHKPF